MWYVLILFVIIFEFAVSWALPNFTAYTPDLTSASFDTTALTSVNTTADVLAAGTNPFSTFGSIMTFQLDGVDGLSFIFWLGWVIIILCLIKLIRGS